MVENKLGRFLGVKKIEGATFHIRGLTVGEYCDLVYKMGKEKLLKDGDRWNSLVLNSGLIDWEGIFDEDGDDFEYDEEAIGFLPDDIGNVLADKIYKELTVLTEDERDKFIASTRFLYFQSEPKNEKIVDTFNCQTCIEKGLAKTRLCGRFTHEQIDEKARELRGEAKNASETPETAPKDLLSKYKTKRNRIKPGREEKTEVSKSGVTLGGFKYPECPVSYVDDWISVLTGMLYHASKANLPFFDGGVVDQPYKLLQAQKIVAGEAGKIESEEIEKERKSADRNSKKR